MPKLLVSVSGHGYGHLVQVSPVLRALAEAVPDLHITVQCALPRDFIVQRLPMPHELIPRHTDVGMLMDGPLNTLGNASLEAYLAFHAGWPRRLAAQQELYQRVKPDLVLADVPYLPLAAAQALGIPNVAFCSLNWVDILAGYCAEDPRFAALAAEIRGIYAAADLFIKPAPSMPMPELANGVDIGPSALVGHGRRAELVTRLNLKPRQRLVIANLGGVEQPLDPGAWGEVEDVQWIVPRAWLDGRAGFHAFEDMRIPFTDLLCSADLLITKPGYGAFTEAACNGVPVLFVERGDWPEEPYLTGWLKSRSLARQVSREDFFSGAMGSQIREFLEQPRPVPVPAHGIGEAVDLLLPMLGQPAYPSRRTL